MLHMKRIFIHPNVGIWMAVYTKLLIQNYTSKNSKVPNEQNFQCAWISIVENLMLDGTLVGIFSGYLVIWPKILLYKN